MTNLDLGLGQPRPSASGAGGATRDNAAMTTQRYEATITLVVTFDAESAHDAAQVAERIVDTVSFPTPAGRGAELADITASSQLVPLRS